jgi:hypothetical protein
VREWSEKKNGDYDEQANGFITIGDVVCNYKPLFLINSGAEILLSKKSVINEDVSYSIDTKTIMIQQ